MPTSPRPYQNDFRKNSESRDEFKKPKVMVLERTISEQKKKNLIDWVTMYRLNIHIFIFHYMNIRLFPYQVLWAYLMNVNDIFVTIASRACGKTWLVAVVSIAKAILWPGSEICVVSQTQKQAGILIAEKIVRLMEESPNIRREIKSWTANNNKYEVLFHNNSKIHVVCAGESGRGERSTTTIYEEFRLLDKEVVDGIVKPFAYSRQPNYLKNPKYKHLVEEPKEIYISSSYYKQHWWYQLTMQVSKMMLEGKNAGVIFFDWPLCVYHGIKTINQLRKEKATMSIETFEQEYCNLVLGASKNSYFSLPLFSKIRNLKTAVYPQRNDTYNTKKNPYFNLKRSVGEIHLLSCDIAMRSGAKNDATIMIFFRLVPRMGKGYLREILYIESHVGMNSIRQSLRIKQLVSDLDIDIVCLDCQNAGIALYDALGQQTKDVQRNVEFPPMTIMKHASIDPKTYDEFRQRTLGLEPVENIYPILPTAKLNSDMAVLLKDRLKKRLFSLLCTETEAEDILIRSEDYRNEAGTDSYIRSFYLNPFLQTNFMLSETLGLDVVLNQGYLKLVEKPGSRKDRFSALLYGNYIASLYDNDLIKEEELVDDWDLIQSLTWFG